MDNNKLNDSIFEDIDTDDTKKEEKENKLEKEVSVDDLFDFKPIGTVGNEESFMKSTLDHKDKPEASKKPQLTKKEVLESILDAPKDETFIDETKINQNINNNVESTSPLRQQVLKQDEEVVLFDKDNETSQDHEFSTLDHNKIKSLIESAMYVSGNEGLSISDLKRLTGAQSTDIKKIMKDWTTQLDSDPTRGISIKSYGERYKLFSKAENREELSKLITIKYRNPLSSKVMETLAIIAYNQPCTRAIIEDVRAKDPTATIQKLIDLGLVAEAGRADTPGRPLLYTVTHKFYDIFGIKNLSELPKINVDQPFVDSDVSFFDTTRFND